MNCPNCQSKNVKVCDSRPDTNSTFRRRHCLNCNYRFSTIEIRKEVYENMKYKIERANRIVPPLR